MAAEFLRYFGRRKATPILSRLRAGLRLRLPVYPHLPLRRSPIAAGLSDDVGGGDDEVMTRACENWFKVRRSCALVDLTLSSRPSWFQWQDKVETAGDR